MSQRNVSWSREVVEDYNATENENIQDSDHYNDRYFDEETTNDENRFTPTNEAAAVHDGRPRCPNCGSKAIEQHGASGASICTECGVVVEENMIVSSVDFVEGAGGSSSMVGQFVSGTSSKAYTGGARRGGGGRYGYSRESREQTLQNARRRIQDVASRLRLGSQTVDAAHRLYVIALERNFVLGRKASHVTAACMYIACRQQKSEHMLIDFSDALQVNVYALGSTFLKFRRMLGLKLELIDPALYIYRFAAHLDLDASANAVSMTALRLVARMKRDWIQTGRRPAGICAAALLIATRAHGFQKHHNDVTRILRVCGMTVNARVREFEQTASARLTLDQFADNQFDFEQENDPPIFTRNRLMEARAKAIQDGNIDLLESGELDNPLNSTKHKAKWRNTRLLQKKDDKINEVYNIVAGELNDNLNINLQKNIKESDESTVNECEGETTNLESNDGSTTITTKQDENDDSNTDVVSSQLPLVDALKAEEFISNKEIPAQNTRKGGVANVKTPLQESWKMAFPVSKYGKAIVLKDNATDEEKLPSTTQTEARISLADWKVSLPKSVDIEIDSMFRTDEEEKQKEAIFNKINAEYIEQLKYKEGRRRSDGQNEGIDENDAGGTKSVKGKYNKRGRDNVEGGTTEEQLMAAVSNRKVSRRINYDALSSIFDEDGTFATDVVVAAGTTAKNSTTTKAKDENGILRYDEPDEYDEEDDEVDEEFFSI